jgi:hypothetical protein
VFSLLLWITFIWWSTWIWKEEWVRWSSSSFTLGLLKTFNLQRFCFMATYLPIYLCMLQGVIRIHNKTMRLQQNIFPSFLSFPFLHDDAHGIIITLQHWQLWHKIMSNMKGKIFSFFINWKENYWLFKNISIFQNEFLKINLVIWQTLGQRAAKVRVLANQSGIVPNQFSLLHAQRWRRAWCMHLQNTHTHTHTHTHERVHQHTNQNALWWVGMDCPIIIHNRI